MDGFSQATGLKPCLPFINQAFRESNLLNSAVSGVPAGMGRLEHHERCSLDGSDAFWYKSELRSWELPSAKFCQIFP
jgi:hypothetical protein